MKNYIVKKVFSDYTYVKQNKYGVIEEANFDNASINSKSLAKKIAKKATAKYNVKYEIFDAVEEFKKVNKEFPLIIDDTYIIDDVSFTKDTFEKYLKEKNLVKIYGSVHLFDNKTAYFYKAELGTKRRIGIANPDTLYYLIDKSVYDSLIEVSDNLKNFLINYFAKEKYIVEIGHYYDSEPWSVRFSERRSFKILKEDYDKIYEELKRDHKAYVIKGTKEPFYFKLDNGKLLGSETKSWYECLRKKFGLLEDFMLEEAID